MAGNNVDNKHIAPENEFPYEWMKEKLGNDFPLFAVNEILLNQFNKLKKLNEKADQDVEKFCTVYDCANNELRLLETKYDAICKSLKMLPRDLPSQSRLNLKQMAQEISVVAKEPSFTTMLDMCELNNDHFHCVKSETTMLLNQAMHDLTRLTNIIAKLNEQRDKLKEKLVYLESRGVSLDDDKCEADKKLAVLRGQRDVVQQEVNAKMQEEEELLHSYHTFCQLRDLQKMVQEKKLEEKQLEDQLVEYGDLPPDIGLARAHVATLREDVKDLKGEIAFFVGTMGGGECFM